MLAAAAIGCRPTPSTAPGPLSEADRAGIRALDTAFVQAWIRDDTAAVIRLFASDAVIFPPGGAPVAGIAAIRAYWWPTDGSHTKITSFTRELTDMVGVNGFAYFRGTASLGWTYEKDGKKSAQTSRSTDLVLVARDSTGAWRIVRQIWYPLP
jgi:uncharacterized protein (TIGR02246 family)